MCLVTLFKIWDYSKRKRVIVYGSGKKQSKLRLQKQSEEENIVKNKRNLFKLYKENEAIKDTIIRDIKTLFKQQEEDYYNPVRVSEFWNNNYIEYESNGDRNKNLSVKEYLYKIKPLIKLNLLERYNKNMFTQTGIRFQFKNGKSKNEFHVLKRTFVF